MNNRPLSILTVAVACLALAGTSKAETLRVSSNGHYLTKSDGSPFFYLADTALAILVETTSTEADAYLQDRVNKGFTVIDMTACWTLGGATFANGDFSQPVASYWSYVDYVINKAESLGLVITLMPSWGSMVEAGELNANNAQGYGQFLGARYRMKPILWLLGGDHWQVSPTTYTAVYRALAKGITIGVAGVEDYSKTLMSFHSYGSSSQWFHNEAWLDFNLQEISHSSSSVTYPSIASDYNLIPTKPTVVGEVSFENIADNLTAGSPKLDEYYPRLCAYQSVFAGAMGYTYGCNEIYMFWEPPKPLGWGAQIWGADTPWKDALQFPGACQMRHLRALIESRPFLIRIPDQSVILSAAGDGTARVQATRGSDGSFAFVYSTDGHAITVDMSKITGGTVKCWWFDPRKGTSSLIGQYPNSGAQSFTPPSNGHGNDWVLVLDDASKNFPVPGNGTPPNLAPFVTLTSPAFGTNFAAGSNIALTAKTQDSDGTVTRVDFYRGSTLIGSSTAAPYSCTWFGATSGTHSLTARATDNGGAVRISFPISITVPTSAQAPVIDSGPSANPSAVTLPVTTTLSVVAHDPDNGPSALTYTWSQVGGLGTTSFSPNGTTASASTTASFSSPDSTIAVLRVTISDGQFSVSGDVSVTVTNPSPVAPNLGFEHPVVSDFVSAPAGAAWTFTGSAGISANASAFTSGNPNAPQGVQVAFIQGNSALSQPLGGFVAGTSYTVVFSAAQRGNWGGFLDFSVSLDGAVIGTFKPTVTTYADYSTPAVIPGAGIHTLKFAGINSAGGDNTIFIDHIRIIKKHGRNSDFNGDVNADLLLRHPSSGSVTLWLFNGADLFAFSK